MLGQFRAFFIIYLTLFCYASSATVAPTWAGTNLIQAGTKIIVSSGTHLQSGTNLYTSTFSPAFSQQPYKALGIISMETHDLHEQSLKFLVNIQDLWSTTQMKIYMALASETAWQSFKVSYIAIDKQFTMIKVDYFSSVNPENVGIGLGQRKFTGYFNLNIGSQDITHKISVVPYIVGLDCSSINGQHSISWSTKLYNSSTISYDLTVLRTTRIFSITSYILIVDRSQLSFDKEQYLDQIYLTGSYNTPSNEQLVFFDVNNLHIGIKSFSFQLTAFDVDKDQLALTTAGYYNSISLAVTSFRERFCNNPAMPYYQENTNLCYDACPSGFVNTDGTSKKYCNDCYNYIFGCKLCSSDGSTCSFAFGNYVIVQPDNTTLICPDGFYQSNLNEHLHPIDKCRSCHFSCATCTGPETTDCITCSRYRSIQPDGTCPCDYGTKLNGYCFGPCDDPGCQQCDADVAICEVCSPTFTLAGSRCICGPRKYYEGQIIECLPCDSSCYYCSGPGEDQCDSCDRPTDKRYLKNNMCLCSSNFQESLFGKCQVAYRTSCDEQGYVLDENLHQCVEICGDGIMVDQECDDLNTQNEDGCSSKCEIEQGYICADNSLAPTRRSYCSFEGELKFKVHEMTKWIYENKMNISFSVTPELHHVFTIYPNMTENIYFLPKTFQIDNINTWYDIDKKIFHSQIQFDQNIQAKSVEMVFKPPKGALTFAVAISHHKFTILSQNNQAAMSYQPDIYVNINIGKIVSMTVTILSLVVATALLFYRKMMGLQLITAIQLIYFGTLLTQYSHPFMGPLTELSFVNGFNSVDMGTGSDLANPPFQTLGLEKYFFENYNFMMILSLVIYLIALLLFVLSQLTQKSNERKLKDASQFFITEIGFGLMVFSLNNVVGSVVLSVIEGTIQDTFYVWDKVVLAVALIIIIAHIAYFFYSVHDISDSQLYYHKSKNYTHYYPLILIFKNITITAMIFLKVLILKPATMVCVAMCGVYIIAVLAGRPYRKFIDYGRFLSIQVTLLFFFIYKLIWDQNVIDVTSLYNNPLDYFFMVSCYVVFAGLFVSIAFTIASFIYHIYLTCQKNSEVAPEVLQANAFQQKDSSAVKLHQRIPEMDKSKQFMVYDVEDEQPGKDQYYLRKGYTKQKYPKGFGLFDNEYGSAETAGSQPKSSSRKMNRKKKRRAEYK